MTEAAKTRRLNAPDIARRYVIRLAACARPAAALIGPAMNITKYRRLKGEPRFNYDIMRAGRVYAPLALRDEQTPRFHRESLNMEVVQGSFLPGGIHLGREG